MSNNNLKELKIQYLRGSVTPFTLPFQSGKKLTILYGENGAGKSTICDAIEFLGKGKVGSLDNRGLGKTNPYWHSIHKHPSNVSVSLKTTKGECIATFDRSTVSVNPLESRPKVEVLRRSQILALVEAQPKERYQAIQRFIDVSSIETAEVALRELIRDIERSRENAIARIEENQTTIEQFYNESGATEIGALEWARQESAREPDVFNKEIEAIQNLKVAYKSTCDCYGKLSEAQSKLQEAQGRLSSAHEKVEECKQSVAQDAAEMVEILEAAQKYIGHNNSLDACPLCGSTEKVHGLADHISQRLAILSELQKAQKNLTSAANGVLFSEKTVSGFEEEVKQKRTDFEAKSRNGNLPKDINLPTLPVPQEGEALSEWLSGSAKLQEVWKKAETDRVDKKSFLNTLRAALTTYNTNIKDQQDIDKLLPALRRGLEVIVEERQKFTDSVLSGIADEVGRLYERVHPNEGLNKISLELDRNKRASLEISASFNGQTNTPPQAYFSESHLDTLGLCIFLALAAMDNAAGTILVLDDILASVDEPHVDRLVEMLHEETARFQHCIITTHYRPWKEKLRWGWLQNGQCHFVELGKWSQESGISFSQPIPEIQRLHDLLQSPTPDIQSISSKAGVILEAILDFLTLTYQCAVPRRPGGRYTLGDLLPVDKKLRQALRVQVYKGVDESNAPITEEIYLGSYFEELHRICQTRNVFGCHFNELSFHLPEVDAISFGQTVLQLAKALIDEENGWPRNNKSGEYWACARKTRKMFPFQKPV